MLRTLLLMPLLATACSRGPCPEVTVDADVPVMATLDWTTDDAATARVEFGVGETNRTLVAPEEASTTHSARLLDLPEASEILYTAISIVEGRESTCSGSFETGTNPPWLPDLQVSVHDDSDTDEDGRYFLGALLDDVWIRFVINRDGDWVWYSDEGADVEIIQSEFRGESADMVYASFNSDHGIDEGKLVTAGWDGEQVDELRLTNGHHVFEQLPDGTVAYLAIDVRDWTPPDSTTPEPVVGDAVVEIGPDGEATTIFSTWDYLEVVENLGWVVSFYPQGADWTHGNSIHYIESRDSYLVSFAEISAIAEVDRATGDPVRWFDGNPPEVHLGVPPTAYTVSGTESFQRQHDPNLTEDGTLLMIANRGLTDATRAAEFAINDSTKTLTQIWTFGLELDETSLALGQTERLGNGNTLYNGGYTGIVREVTHDGAIVWQANLDGAQFGQLELVPDLRNGESF